MQRFDLNTGQTQSVRPSVPGAGGRGGGGGGGRGGGRGNVINTPEPDTIVQFNWNTPIRLSPHNPSTVLVGGRQLFISRDRGQTWTISKSLGKNIDLNQRTILEDKYSLPSCGRGSRGQPCILSRHDGYVENEYGSVTELAESPVLPGVIWAGTDDGNLQVSKDDGLTFTEVGVKIPVSNHEYYVSGIEASWYDAGTAYVALDGHRNDDAKPYVFKTTDYGQTWKSISSDLPDYGWVNSIRQDPVNQNLLYAPTEYGFYISFDDGAHWKAFMPNLPTFRVDEVLVHPRDHDLILATHSRGIWIMDDITPLQQMTAETMAKDAVVFAPREAIQWKPDRKNQTEVPGDKWWEGEVAPRGTAIAYWLKSAASDVKVTITNTATNQAVRTCIGTGNAGLNRFQWMLTGDPQPGGGGGFGGRGGGRGRGAARTAAGAHRSDVVHRDRWRRPRVRRRRGWRLRRRREQHRSRRLPCDHHRSRPRTRLGDVPSARRHLAERKVRRGFRGSGVPGFRGSGVPRFRGSEVPRFRGSEVPRVLPKDVKTRTRRRARAWGRVSF